MKTVPRVAVQHGAVADADARPQDRGDFEGWNRAKAVPIYLGDAAKRRALAALRRLSITNKCSIPTCSLFPHLLSCNLSTLVTSDCKSAGAVMTAQPKQSYSIEAYLDIERAGPIKHEFYRGEIFALAGSSEAHNLILTNILMSLGTQLRKRPCKVYPSDMRLKISQTGLYTYPDVSIVCGPPQFDDSKQDTLLNPIIVIEILSPSTERYDRGKKFQNYRTVATLQGYVLVSQDEYHIEHYMNQNNGNWLLTTYDGRDATLVLKAVDCTLLLDDVYDKVDIVSSDENPPEIGG